MGCEVAGWEGAGRVRALFTIWARVERRFLDTEALRAGDLFAGELVKGFIGRHDPCDCAWSEA